MPDSVNPIYSATTGSEAGWSLATTDNHVIMGTLVNEVVIYERNQVTDALEAQVVLDPGVGGFTGYGGAVDMDDSTAIVGARNYMNNGGVFVYRLSGGTWNLEQVLAASDGASGDNFGKSISIHGDNIVVGSNGNNGNIGAVYWFNRSGSTWTEMDKYVPSGSNQYDGVGAAVAIHGDTVLCTAPGTYNGTVGFTGSGYVCSIASGSFAELQTLTAEAGQWSFYDDFGSTCSISAGGHLLIGATGSEVSGTDCGAVFAWHTDGGSWSPMEPITPSSPESGEQFGTSIATHGENFAVGSPGFNSWKGRAVTGVLKNNVSFTTQSIQPKTAGSSASSGQSVAFMNNRVFVGCNYGQVYVGLNDTGGYTWWDQCLELFETDIIWSGNDLVSQDFDADSYTWYWIDESGLFPTVNQVGVGNTHTPAFGGTYYLVLEKDGCQVHIELYVSPVGIDELLDSKIELMPNPVSDVLYVNSTTTNGTLEVLSVEGKVVKTETINGTVSIDVNDLDAGIYILRVSESGQVGQTRFVKVE